MKKTIFKEYAQLKIEAREIEERIKAMQPEVMEAMGDNEEVISEYGVFTKAHRRDWIYPSDIELAATALKESKKRAEQLGDASYTENEYLLFKPATVKE